MRCALRSRIELLHQLLRPIRLSRIKLLLHQLLHPIRLDECCAAYLSDQPLLLTSLRPHGIQFPSPRLGAIATLDHSMWFHAPFHADEWLLFEMSSPHAGAGRALSFGHLYSKETGALVVSCAQQGIIRLAKPSVTGTAATIGLRISRLTRLFEASSLSFSSILNRLGGGGGLGGGQSDQQR
mmetsp:Transcript_72940/g.162051  ORF Transcript_72940/g.162051 Transcript_72940/m.162051 type:complete len:182 (-) Transcript_72940:197-742(-)